jgi:hypothetical protein
MNDKIILYILGFMIFYNLLIHVVWLFKLEDFFLSRKINFWPNFGKEKSFNRTYYQIFWTVYWMVALTLVILFILKNN